MRAYGSSQRLSDEEIDEIREVYKDIGSYAETGRALGVSAGTVSRIIRRVGVWADRGERIK